VQADLDDIKNQVIYLQGYSKKEVVFKNFNYIRDVSFKDPIADSSSQNDDICNDRRLSESFIEKASSIFTIKNKYYG